MILAFGSFEFDHDRWELRRVGVPVEAPPKVMQTIAVLLRGRGRLVTNAELRSEVWPNVTVTEASIRKSIRMARSVLDGEATGSYIKTTRGRGYRFVGDVREVSPARLLAPSESVPARLLAVPDPFVGRARELAELHVALADASAARPRFILVSGEPGMGKTRLVEEFSLEATRAGARVLFGRCCEEGGAPELRPWAQILSALLPAERGNDNTEWATREIARILPGAFDPGRAAKDPPSEADRFGLFESITELIRHGAADRVLILVLEDLHAADAATLLLLRFIAREVRAHRLVLVGTYRPEDVGSNGSGSSLGPKLKREARTLALEGWTEAQIRELMHSALGVPPPDDLVLQVHAVTEGNPFFVSEMVRLLHSATTSPPREGSPVRIPERIVEVVRDRLDLVPEETREVLSVAAVIGREFDVPLLERVSGLSQREVTLALTPAQTRRIVSPESPLGGAFRFTHILFRDVLYDGLAVTRRAEIHHRVGEVLETLQTNAAPAALLAHHFSRARLGAGSRRSATHSLAAGRAALNALAFEEAGRHFEQALDALRFDVDEGALRSEILLSLGHALRSSGDYARAAESFARSLRAAETQQDAVGAARAALAFAQVKPELGTLANQDVIAALEGVLGALETVAAGDATARELLVLVLSRLATAYSLAGRRVEGEAVSFRASEIARSLELPESLAHALLSRHWLIWRPGTGEERLSIASELCRLDTRMTDPQLREDARICRITDLLELGRRGQLDAALDEHERFASAGRDPMSLWTARVYESMNLILEGRLAEAEASVHATFPIGLGLQEKNARMLYGAHLSWIRIEQGRAKEFEEPLRHLIELRPADVMVRASLLRIHVETERTAEAAQGLAALFGEEGERLEDDWTLLPCLAHLAAASLLVGDTAAARLIRARLAPHDGTHIVMGPGLLYLGPVSLHLGLSSRCLGDLDLAIASFKQATQESDLVRARPTAARAEAHLAEALLSRGRPGDAASSAAAAARALSRARQIGMGRIEGVAEELLKTLHRKGVAEPLSRPD